MASHLKDVHEAIIRNWSEMTRKQRREWLRENVPDYHVPNDKKEHQDDIQ